MESGKCIDFTNLNEACHIDNFPLPMIDQLEEATVGHDLLSFMDSYSGYNQIILYPPAEDKTTITTDRGIYCYKMMPFELKNAGSTFQRMVNRIFKDLIGHTIEVYINDILVKSLRRTNHVQNLSEAFYLLQEYKVKLKLEKCTFGVASGKFLGYLIT